MTRTLRAEPLRTRSGTRLWLDDQRWAHLPQAEGALVNSLMLTAASQTPHDHQESTPQHLDDLLEGLQPHQMARDSRDLQSLHELGVAVVGSGSLAREVIADLHAAGLRRIHVHDPRRPSSHEWSDATQPTCGHALAFSLANSRGIRVAPIADDEELLRRSALVVLATTTAEPDRVLLDKLVELSIPHLVVRSHRGVGRVGPFVVPGETACMRCLDLECAGSDPDRAEVISQLTRIRSQPDRIVNRWLSSRTAMEIAWWASGHQPTLAARVETMDREHPAIPAKAFAASSRCSCGASQLRNGQRTQAALTT